MFYKLRKTRKTELKTSPKPETVSQVNVIELCSRSLGFCICSPFYHNDRQIGFAIKESSYSVQQNFMWVLLGQAHIWILCFFINFGKHFFEDSIKNTVSQLKMENVVKNGVIYPLMCNQIVWRLSRWSIYMNNLS